MWSGRQQGQRVLVSTTCLRNHTPHEPSAARPNPFPTLASDPQGDLGLNICEAHAFNSTDRFSLDIFVVRSPPRLLTALRARAAAARTSAAHKTQPGCALAAQTPRAGCNSAQALTVHKTVGQPRCARAR